MLIKRLEKEDKGSYCTFHAQSSRDALTRLKKLGVLEIDLLALDLIIVQRRWTSIESSERMEKRRIIEISEVLESEGRALLNKVFEFNFRKDCLEAVNESIRIKEKFSKASSESKSFEKELEKFRKEIESSARKSEKSRIVQE